MGFRKSTLHFAATLNYEYILEINRICKRADAGHTHSCSLVAQFVPIIIYQTPIFQQQTEEPYLEIIIP